MINDYKFRIESDDFGRPRRHLRLAIFALTGLALGASALYAAMSGDKELAEIPTPTTVAENQPSPAPELKTVSLALPGSQATEEQTVEPALNQAAADASPIAQEAMDPPRVTLSLKTPTQAIEQPEAAAEMQETLAETTPETPEPPAAAPGKWLEAKVKSGDSLARIFSQLGLPANLLHRIVNSSPEAKQLARIRPGETFRVHLSDSGEMLELEHRLSAIRSRHIRPEGDSFRVDLVDQSLEKRITTVSGTITNSLFEAAMEAGLSDSLTMELANIFGWDIDFALEIRAGDQFSLIYEEEFLDGEKYRNGNILAAEFVNRGKTFRAIRFEDEHGRGSFYSPDGKSMRKAFLRSPVDFRRISSRFSKSRKHPVYGKKRAHKGVDYAAATGTPIKAAGDGRVIFRGNKGGYGRTVIIRHGSQYTTLYAHMSKFRSSVRNGTRVSQGQTIGYVGRSGTATGPHLHYEFRVNGVHRNPLTVKIPAAEPLQKKYRERFAQISAPLQAQLDSLSSTMVADAQ